jgi:hypothetical protein
MQPPAGVANLFTSLTSGNSVFNFSDKPKLIEARRLIICCRPSLVRCSLRSIRSTTCLNNSIPRRGLAHFWVNRGYLSKWPIITFKPLRVLTRYWIESLCSLYIFPTPSKNHCIDSNKTLSLLWTEIWK